jgi:hypothetical protein
MGLEQSRFVALQPTQQAVRASPLVHLMPTRQKLGMLRKLVRAEEFRPQRLLVTHLKPLALGARQQTQHPASLIAMPTLQPIARCTLRQNISAGERSYDSPPADTQLRADGCC